jgi:predicted O-methyltransferase YrrM
MDRRQLELRLRHAPDALRKLVQDRSWLREYVGTTGRQRHTLPRIDLSSRPAGMTAAAAVAATLGVTQPEYERTVVELWKPEVQDTGAPASRKAREELQDVTGAVVRLTHPMVVLEIGATMGVKSPVILAALEANGDGQLYSVDIPAQASKPQEFGGSGVPEKLKPRWTLELGPSRQLLPELVQHVAPIDVFLHDGHHAHAGQLEEYRTAWPHLRPGAVLVSYNVRSPAFLQFAGETGAEPHLIGGDGEHPPLGMMRKPSA